MEEYIIHGLMGAGVGLLIAGAGYLKTISKNPEAFDIQKAGLSLVVGVVCGAAIASGAFNYEGVMVILSMAGLSHYGETVGKSVWNFLGPATESKKK